MVNPSDSARRSLRPRSTPPPPRHLAVTSIVGFPFSVLGLLLCVLGLPAIARAHPIHASYAEADFRPATGKLEIALRLFTDDTEAALSKRRGQRIAFGRTPAAELDALLLAYVRATFAVKSPTGAAVTLAWVGRELKDGDQHLWLYFECPLPGGLAGARFSQGVLRDAFSDQLNSVVARDHTVAPTRQVTLLFPTAAEQTVVFPR